MLIGARQASRQPWGIAAGLLAGAAVAAGPPIIVLPAALLLLGLALLPLTPLAALAALLTLAPIRSLVATEAPAMLPLANGQLLIVIFFGVWLLHRIMERRSILSLERNPVLLALIGMSAVFALGAWTSHAIAGWLNEWLKWVLMTVLVWQLSLTIERNWRWLIFALILSAVANAVVGLYIFFGGSGADHLAIFGDYFRAFGTFGQPNPFGGFMGLALPLALTGCIGEVLSIGRTWRGGSGIRPARLAAAAGYGLACLLLAGALGASWSRGAWLGFAVSSLVMAIAYPRRLRHGVALALGAAALFLMLWLGGVLPASIVNRLTTAATDLVTVADVRGIEFYPWNYAVVERLAHWQAAIGMATDFPLFGVGLGNYEVVYEQYRLVNWEDALGHAHNLYLNLLAEAGALGSAAYLAFWLLIFRLTWALRRHPDSNARSAATGLLGCWTYIAVHSLFDNLYVNNLFLHIGVLLAVLAVLQRQISHTLNLD